MQGIGAGEGCTLGPVYCLDQTVPEPAAEPRAASTSAQQETERFTTAAKQVATALGTQASAAAGTARDVLEATAEMATDPGLLNEVSAAVSQRSLSAERAVWEAAGEYRKRLEDLGGYLGERAADVADVRDRIIAALTGAGVGFELPDHPVVLVARSLSPADTAQLDGDKVRAIVTVQGGPQAHSAILARALGIPAVVGCDEGVLDIPQGAQVFVDGGTGTVTDTPGQEQIDEARRWQQEKAETPAFSGQGRTADGHHVQLLANIGSAADAERAAAAGAEGIGLLRTEFLFLDRADEPSVEEQAEVYAQVFTAFPDKKVVIRTLDAGSDKPMPFITSAQPGGSESGEPNPALGMRGYRTASFAPDILKRQLEAIALADSRTNADVQVMAPMITTADEAAAFADLVHTAGLATAGIMVETPQAALCANAVLEPVAFASIGTNDLTQYALAFDRELPEYAGLQSAAQPAVLTLIGATCAGAATAGSATTPVPAVDSSASARPVGVCGEAAADPRLAVVLVGLGVDSLSMSAPALPRVAAALKSVTMEQARDAARTALSGSVFQDGLIPAEPATQPTVESEHSTTSPAGGTSTAGQDIDITIAVTAPTGLHARPAAVLAKAVKALDADVTIFEEGDAAGVSAASIMEMMALGVESGQTIRVVATGPEAQQAVSAVQQAAQSEG